MDFNQIVQTVTTIGIAFGLKVAGAIVVWVVGRYLIGLAVRLVSNALEKQRVDPTVLRYLGTVISVTLNIILVVAILGYFGVETTTFAALFAAGAKPPRDEPRRPDLRLAAQRALNLLLNVDTSRVLNPEAFRRAADRLLLAEWPEGYFEKLLTPGAALSPEEVGRLGRVPRLTKLTLADGCDAITSNEVFATVARMAVRASVR